MIYGQLTVIAGKTGPIMVRWGALGSELADLDAVRNDWKGDAKIMLVANISKDRAIEIMLGLYDDDYWVGGLMFERASLPWILKIVAQSVAEELEDA